MSLQSFLPANNLTTPFFKPILTNQGAHACPLSKMFPCPANGQAHYYFQRQAQCARPPDHPVHRGRRHRPDIWRASVRVFDAAVAEGLRRQEEDRVDGSPRRREGVQAVQQLAARRHGRRVPRVSRRHQGPADHADRRRHPLAQRRAAADARPVRLPAAGALLHGRAVAGEAPGEGRHGDLPREHRGHLRRHRIRRRARRKRRRSSTSCRRISRRNSRRSASARRKPATGRSSSKASAPAPRRQRGSRHRLQARQLLGTRTAGPLRHRLRHQAQAQERHARPQGQHHEVHGGRLP